MPNPRITFRLTPDLLAQLPDDAEERSRFVVEAIQAKLNPPAPGGEVGQLLTRIETVENAVVMVLEKLEHTNKRREPTELDQAIKTTLERIKPSERRQAAKILSQLQGIVSS